MEQFINTASQVVMALVTLGGLWLTLRQQMNRLAKDREERLTQLQADVENTLHDQDTMTRQLHKENQMAFSVFKDTIVDKIHRIEISLARAGINGHLTHKSGED